MQALVFEKVRLTGFKSFVMPTEFILAPGLTGIVGPNGCGKSNILEALRWVMGASSAKAMRAPGMEDVIFSGTKTRPGRNQASVRLTIDNRAHVAPDPFNEADKLEVIRQITVGKGSRYMVNGKVVRAKDVQRLFADVSTGANSVSLVRQGQISELIAAKPENRRRILEEAAGISGLHSRRYEAELRLRAAKGNLERLEDVIAQIENQLLSLRRQSRQAVRYRRLVGEMDEYRALLWYRRWQDMLESLAAAQRQLQTDEADVQMAEQVRVRCMCSVTTLSEKVAPKREARMQAVTVLSRLEAMQMALDKEIEGFESHKQRLAYDMEQVKSDRVHDQTVMDECGFALEQLEVEYKTLSEPSDEESRLAAAQADLETCISVCRRLEADHARQMQQVAEDKAYKDSLEREHTQAQTRLGDLQTEQTQLQQQLSDLEGGDDEQDSFTQSLRQSDEVLTHARSQVQALAQTCAQAEDAEDQAREASYQARQLVTRLDTEHQTLRELLWHEEGQNWQTALSQTRVSAGYETALAAALGDDLAGAIGESQASMNWAGVPSAMSLPALPSGVEPLSDHVQAPPALAVRLTQVGLIDATQLGSAVEALKPGQRLVTRQGHMRRWDGFEVQATMASAVAARLEQGARLDVLQLERTAAGKRQAEAGEAFESARKNRDQLQARLRVMQADLVEHERKNREAQVALAQHQADVVSRQSKRRSQEGHLQRLQTELCELTSLCTQLHQACQAQVERVDQGGDLQGITDELQAARTQADTARKVLQDLQLQAQARNSRVQALQTELAYVRERNEMAVQRIKILDVRANELAEQMVQIKNAPDEFASRQERLQIDLAEAEQHQQGAVDALSGLEAELREAQQTARGAEADYNRCREARAASEARHAAALERRQEIQARIVETIQCSPDELALRLKSLDVKNPLSEPDIERKITRLQAERERLGDVNMRADTEAERQAKTLADMAEEHADLNAAIDRLHEAIESLNKDGRKRLLQAFETVNRHFSNLFEVFFGGGEAALQLTQSEDPLKAGLDIQVRPPGKKSGALSLLSGGEQALTAMALIFAVFLSHPAPVCVLDEVDAPLDDVNVERFCELLDEMCRRTDTRFIIITHNPMTMSRMDRLFGVTMAEPGVSQVVSIELSETEKIRASI